MGDSEYVGETLAMDGSFELFWLPTGLRGIVDSILDFGAGGRALCAEGKGSAFPLLLSSPTDGFGGGTGKAFENRDLPALTCQLSSIF